jgi:hypothetical protein
MPPINPGENEVKNLRETFEGDRFQELYNRVRTFLTEEGIDNEDKLPEVVSVWQEHPDNPINDQNLPFKSMMISYRLRAQKAPQATIHTEMRLLEPQTGSYVIFEIARLDKRSVCKFWVDQDGTKQIKEIDSTFEEEFTDIKDTVDLIIDGPGGDAEAVVRS